MPYYHERKMATRRGNTMKNRPGAAVLLGVLALGSILAMTSCWPTVDLTGLSIGGNTDTNGVTLATNRMMVMGQTVVKARGTAGSSSVLMTANELRIQPAIYN
jgi:hypothetical protein